MNLGAGAGPDAEGMGAQQQEGAQAAQGGQQEDRGTRHEPRALVPSDIHVLLVDDESVARVVVASLLRKCSYRVTVAASGREALTALRDSTQAFHLLLTDVVMPDMSGIELLRHVRADERLHMLPVIMMSATETTDTVFECIRSGAEDYLLKPVTRKEVQHIWQHVWRRRTAQQSVPELRDDDGGDAVGESCGYGGFAHLGGSGAGRRDHRGASPVGGPADSGVTPGGSGGGQPAAAGGGTGPGASAAPPSLRASYRRYGGALAATATLRGQWVPTHPHPTQPPGMVTTTGAHGDAPDGVGSGEGEGDVDGDGDRRGAPRPRLLPAAAGSATTAGAAAAAGPLNFSRGLPVACHLTPTQRSVLLRAAAAAGLNVTGAGPGAVDAALAMAAAGMLRWGGTTVTTGQVGASAAAGERRLSINHLAPGSQPQQQQQQPISPAPAPAALVVAPSRHCGRVSRAAPSGVATPTGAEAAAIAAVTAAAAALPPGTVTLRALLSAPGRVCTSPQAVGDAFALFHAAATLAATAPTGRGGRPPTALVRPSRLGVTPGGTLRSLPAPVVAALPPPSRAVATHESFWYASPEAAALEAPALDAAPLAPADAASSRPRPSSRRLPNGGPGNESYALGVLLFELLCPAASTALTDHAAVSAAAASGAPPPPSSGDCSAIDRLSAWYSLRHRVVPPTLTESHPAAVALIIALLHPDPGQRPSPASAAADPLITAAAADAESRWAPARAAEESLSAAVLTTAVLRALATRRVAAKSRALAAAAALADDARALGAPCDPLSSAAPTPVSARIEAALPALEGAYLTRREAATAAGGGTLWLESWGNDVAAYTRYSTLSPVATVRQAPGGCGANEMVCAMAFDADDAFFATAGVARAVRVYDYAAVTAPSDRALYCPIAELRWTSKLSSLSWNGYLRSHLAAGDYDGGVQLWDVAACGGGGSPLRSLTEHSRRVWSVDFCRPEPTRLASGSDDGTVRLWALNVGASVGTLDCRANICSVQFNPGVGHLLAIGSADYRTYYYDLRNPSAPLAVLAGHAKAVSYVRFLDASTLVTASTDNTLKLWDVEAAAAAGGRVACERSFSGHTNEKNFVGLSATADGYIACGSEGTAAYVYHRSMSAPVAHYEFSSQDPVSGCEVQDDGWQFVSSVCWRRKGHSLLAANSGGSIKVLQLT